MIIVYVCKEDTFIELYNDMELRIGRVTKTTDNSK